MKPLLQVAGLCRHFGGLKAVDGLSFEIAEREIVGLIGPNGAGKTTAVNLISGLLKKTCGTVSFDGVDVSRERASQLAARGLVRTFQHTALYYERTVLENVRRATYLSRFAGVLSGLVATARGKTMAREADARAVQLLALFKLDSVAQLLAKDLPYGHQKILGIVLALAVRPRLILLDEPVAGLSAEETDRVRDVIREIRAGGVAVMVIEHNMRFISGLCDRVVVMAHGQPLARGTPRQVLADPNVIEAYLGKRHAPAAR